MTRRVLLFAMGTPDYVASQHHAGPGLRSGHFATALAEDGCQVLVLAVNHEGAAALAPELRIGSPERVTTYAVSEASLSGAAVAALISEFDPHCLVAVTVYAAKLAVEADLSLPLWADVFGDMMAEAQAKAALSGSDWPLMHFWSLLVPVLERADAFSAVSSRQADALIGQLGLAGRLTAATAGDELVAVIPCAARAALPLAEGGGATLRGASIPQDALMLLWSGGFNTWCDIELLFDELESAMSAAGDVYFVATGGSIAGHDERTYQRAQQRRSGSRFADRMLLLGWVDDGKLASLYAESDFGIVVERALYERRLGSENRVAQWLAHGLLPITTARSPFGEQLCRQGVGVRLDPAAGRGLATVLEELRASADGGQSLREGAIRFALEELSFAETARPLLRWCRAAEGTGGKKPAALTLGLLSRPETAVAFLEAYLAELSLGQVAYRSLRWMLRRLLGGAGKTG